MRVFDRWLAGNRWRPAGTQWMVQFTDETQFAQFWIDADIGTVELDDT